MTTDWALYDKLLAEKEKETEIILIEAEKMYKQAKANYEAAKRDRSMWNEGIEEKLKGMEQSGLYTAQKDHGTWDFI